MRRVALDGDVVVVVDPTHDDSLTPFWQPA
jgi:hypothetical protein